MAVEKLIDQALQQGAAHIYIIDNSPPEFDTFKDWKTPPDVTIVRPGRNLGYGRAHNLAIKESVRQHSYHLVCNPDITLGDSLICVLHDFMEQARDVGLCMPKVVDESGQTQHLCKRLPSPIVLIGRRFLPASWLKKKIAIYEMRDRSYDVQMDVPCLSGCFMFFRSSVLERLGGFDERFFMYMEDFDLSRRASIVGRNVYFPRATVVHGHSRGSYHSWRLLAIHIVSATRYFNKWGWLVRVQ